MTHGRKTGGGSRRGKLNHVTTDVREAIALIAQRNVEPFESWLAAVRDPARRCEIYLKALAFHLPLLQRAEISAAPKSYNGEPIRSAQDAAEVYQRIIAGEVSAESVHFDLPAIEHMPEQPAVTPSVANGHAVPAVVDREPLASVLPQAAPPGEPPAKDPELERQRAELLERVERMAARERERQGGGQ